MTDKVQIEQRTGELYTKIWELFNDSKYREFADVMWNDENQVGIADPWFADKICLDVGCGGGRACYSLAKANARTVYGVDLTLGALAHTQRICYSYTNQVKTVCASAFGIPFPDRTFDFVHCNGVLHCTPDPLRGLSELTRVLKPGGRLFLSLYGKGGAMMACIGFARLFRKLIPFDVSRVILQQLIRDPVMWYAVLDSMYVPIRKAFREGEVRQWLERDFVDVTRVPCRFSFNRGPAWVRGEGFIMFNAVKRTSPVADGLTPRQEQMKPAERFTTGA